MKGDILEQMFVLGGRALLLIDAKAPQEQINAALEHMTLLDDEVEDEMKLQGMILLYAITIEFEHVKRPPGMSDADWKAIVRFSQSVYEKTKIPYAARLRIMNSLIENGIAAQIREAQGMK